MWTIIVLSWLLLDRLRGIVCRSFLPGETRAPKRWLVSLVPPAGECGFRGYHETGAEVDRSKYAPAAGFPGPMVLVVRFNSPPVNLGEIKVLH